MHYIGLGKTLFNSSVCFLPSESRDLELILTERITRKKASGAWPEEALRMLESRSGFSELKQIRIAENRDVLTPLQRENNINQVIPFFDSLQSSGLAHYSRHSNPNIEFISHHLCHASAAALLAPFAKALIVVMDGAGTEADDLVEQGEKCDLPETKSKRLHEAVSIYLFDRGKIRCVNKHWQTFAQSQRWPEHYFSQGLGTTYEKAAEYIFNSKRASGKVMGLAAFGHSKTIPDRVAYLESLDWTKAFAGKTKAEWEACSQRQLFADIAATVQHHYEESVSGLFVRLRKTFAEYENLIFTGGSALNCTNNMKVVESGLFASMYIPPFPGDECAGLGAAAHLYLRDHANAWEPVPHELQQGYFGPQSSEPRDSDIASIFADFEITAPPSIIDFTVDALARGEVIGWFQGRSESGPRALGNRSILAKVDRPGLKEYLNERIKFREAFRPYGCSVTHEMASEYFAVPAGFNNPFMSFAVRTRNQYLERLSEVTHVDGTSRMQTVRPGQNKRFYDLLTAYGKRTGLFCLLNTSLNVMGEPIVETLQDLRHFLDATPVDGVVAGNCFIRKRR